MTETTAVAPETTAQPAPQIVPYFPGMTREQLTAAKPAEAAPTTTNVTVTPVRREKVAILGFVGHFQQAPFQDDSWEIWGLNELYDHIPRWTRWFELHDRALYENDRNRTSAHVDKLKSFPTSVPIYMHRHWDDIPASVAYPINDIARIFPNPCPEARPYLTNSITYMILLAIAEGFKDISIFGVDMAHDSEYASQRPSCEWAIGIAQGSGRRVYLPAESDLLKTVYLYGYEAAPTQAFERKLRARHTEMVEQVNRISAEIERLKDARSQYVGAQQDVESWLKNWKSIPIQTKPTTS